MSAGFNREILAQKLARLNCSQQSIETLSHWCGFHHRYCRQVVETWDGEFRSAPCERRVALLYLANDIMQTSKRERSAYVIEFMRVIPTALDEAFTNGDNNVRHVVKRLIGIWEDRKLFDIEGQNLNDDFFRRFRDLKSKLKKPGEILENIVSSYKHVLNPPIDEDNLMRKCQGSLSTFDNLVKAYGNNSYLGNSNGSGFVEDLQEQHSIIRTSIEQLKTSESLRTTLITHLKQALNEQEHKMEQVRSLLQAAQSRYRKADELCKELGIDVERREAPNHGTNFISLEKGESSAVIYSQEGGHGEHNGKAANVVKKFGSVPDSDKILGGVLSPRANGGNNTQKIQEHSSANKRQKHEDDAYISQPRSLPSPPPPPPFPHPDTFQPPPPQYPPSPEPTPPPPPPQYPPSPEPTPPPPPPQYPTSPEPAPPPPLPQIIPPPFPTSMPPQLMPPVPTIAGPFVPFPPGLPSSLTELSYSPFPSFTPVVNFPMANMPSGLPSARSPPPAFQGLWGPFNGPPPYPAAPPTMDKKLE
ncbi:hypothetical protein ACP4OV_029756 [Aristida adscensionis]